MEENVTDENSSIQYIPIPVIEEKLTTLKASSPEAGEKEKPIDETAPVVVIQNEEATEIKTPEPPAEPEKLPEEPKEPEVVKKIRAPPRRRSSLGVMILNTFIAPGTESTMSPIERPVRPRRSVQIKIQPEQVARPVRPVLPQPIRYSFDLGERVAIKSCLKSSRSNSVPASKSLTKKTADKIIGKYRKSGGYIHMKTPMSKQRSKLKFHNICSIRVITPRPGYNPNKLELPHSDDEADKVSNPNRERLSTVELQLTPKSQAQLLELREEGVVQFNASMVFGDGESFVAPTTSSFSPSEADIATMEDPETIGTSSTSDVDSEPKIVEKKKRSYRRKSLILGAASPMKSPAKIEKPRFEDAVFEESNETTSGPPRRSRRSVRLNKQDVIEPTKESDVVLQEREETSQKKRGLVQEEAPHEPNAKRSRRKSGFIRKDDDVVVDEKKKETEKPKTIHPFFAPKKVEEKTKAVVEEKKSKKQEKTSEKTDKPEKHEKLEKPKKPEDKEKIRKRTRRSSAYFGVADTLESSEDIIVLETSKPSTSSEKVPEAEVVTETTLVASSSSSSSLSASSQSKEKITTKEFVPSSPKPGNIASIFIRSPAQPKKVLEIKESEASTSNPQSSTTPSTTQSSSKLFSLFSPKPKPDSSSDSPITISDSPIAPPPKPRELFKCPQKSTGVKRQEHWGDRHPETYEFILKMPTQKSIFEGTNSCDNPIFNARTFDENILNIGDIDWNLKEIDDTVDTNVLMMKKENARIKKLEVPEGSYATNLFPSRMEDLVEGADEKEVIQRWLREWKKRVRKDREKEFQKKNDKRKKGPKKSKKKRNGDESEDDDSSDDYEMGNQDLENPLVLIGPTGVGKTALVKALAKEENMRIIWVGPETDRSGAEIKRQLFEALRSHRVDQQPSQVLSAFFKTVSQTTFVSKEEKPKEFVQSLVVFEHVDVFFDTLDRNGVNGLLEVINDSAVPVVFTRENDWPRLELKRSYLEIRMGRNEKKVQKYVQKVVNSCREVSITDPAIRQLSESVNHDLRALLHQAHFFSLAHKKPFPLSSRHLVPNGFGVEWEKPRNSLRNDDENERLEHLMDLYSEILPDGFINPLYPGIERSWDSERRSLAARQSEPLGALQTAYEALNGRYSKRDLSIDVLPLLVPIDRVERQKTMNRRRHLHQFRTDEKTDGVSLIDAVWIWRFPENLISSS
ncbi:hypothetical protein CAEBREN_24174 [Caenorhabditis brenneri]|uniref:AAA+ ATPase domain-containing protein n=1 Tax=Caenorhabditis brenneri TaxID=135651 RepID=G0MZ29_CAEBE|nr:hypothetical protein CAEBREN_24174 [Caenorhabditis brenneri]